MRMAVEVVRHQVVLDSQPLSEAIGGELDRVRFRNRRKGIRSGCEAEHRHVAGGWHEGAEPASGGVERAAVGKAPTNFGGVGLGRDGQQARSKQRTDQATWIHESASQRSSCHRTSTLKISERGAA